MSAVRETVKTVLRQTGLLAPIRSLRDRFEGPKPPAEVTRNQGQCWFFESEEFHTRAYVYNYWTENYKIPDAELSYTLFDGAGRQVAAGTTPLTENCTAVFHSRELVDRHHLQRPFDGILLLGVQHSNLAPRRVLQFNIDFLYGSGGITSVHGQGTLHPDDARFHHDRLRLPAQPGLKTWLMLLNHSLQAREYANTVWLRNHKGERREAQTLRLPYHQHRKVMVSTGCPECLRFLDGQDGGIEVDTPVDPMRVLVMVEDPQRKRFVVNHSTNEATTGGARIPLATRHRLGYGPVLPTAIVDTPERYTRFQFHNAYSDEDRCELRCRIFDEAGTPCGKPVILALPARGSTSRTSRELLDEAGISGESFVGGLIVDQVPLDEPLTQVMDIVLELVERNGDSEEWAGTLTGGAYANCPESFARRTKIFSRTLFTDEYRSELWLVNPAVLPDWPRRSDTTVFLFDCSGAQQRSAKIAVPSNGLFRARLDELFPDIREVLASGGGIGQVKVRDVSTHMLGYHIVKHLPTGTLALDHLYGG